ncbi:F-box/LRR-repeat protein 4 [Habropoda laboriosa]|uniref:F-box/LRR-repeat protein 4 n=1 Tax=Habropoda laboriosa TaxID=597456 RepID=A0A0L7R9T9_9HYME|nr:F-box/LRR-repeat protein 4 [Habropoda laboriosa]
MISHDEIKVEVVPINGERIEGKEETVVFIEQFVKHVCDFSSQYGSNISISYTAYNIAGNPSKFPDYGDFPQAFVMVYLEYYQEVYPIRVSIYETYNPGSVVGIWAQNSEGKWYQLWSGFPQVVPHKPRIFSPNLQLCNFKTKMIRLEFNHSLLDYYTELDAVLFIGTSELIVPNNLHNQTLNELAQELGYIKQSNNDIYNLTPEYLKANQDLTILKRTLSKHCKLFKSKVIDNISKSKLVSKIGQHYQSVPPIEEAFNSLQQFLQEDFPKLIRDIHHSIPNALNEQDNSPQERFLMPLTDSENQPCGSFSALPDETVLKILKNLDLKSLCHLSRVNRHFNNITRDALLYTSLNLKPYWHCLDTSALNCLAPRCHYLQQLDLSWCGNYSMIKYQDFIHFLHTSGTLLTHLRLNCCQFVNDAIIFEISKVCKNLKVAVVLGKSCPYLESVDFWKAQTLTPHGVTALSRCTNLREVDFGWCGGMGAPGDSLRTLLSSCRYLEKVFLAALRGLTDRDLEPLLLCQRLQQLDLLGARSLTPDICYGFLLFCPKLEMIDLSFCEGINDFIVQLWRQQYPHVSIKRSFQVYNSREEGENTSSKTVM